MRLSHLLGSMVLSTVTTFSVPQVEPNPPKWPSSVAVFSPEDPVTIIQDKIAAAIATNGGHTPANHGQFSTYRYAFLFKPGSYDIDCPVGYYTQVLGLGTLPSDVTFTSPKGVYAEEQDYTIGGSLSTFWRSAENFKTAAYNDWKVAKGMLWAVSQAAPLRRVEVVNDLSLFEYQPPIPAAGEASGGYMANMKVGSSIKSRPRFAQGVRANTLGNVEGVLPGSQQQWFARDSTVNAWTGGVWNMVFTGVEGAPPSHCGLSANSSSEVPVINIPATPSISEKPFITIGSDGKYSLQIPPLKSGSSGADFSTADTAPVGFEKVYVTKPSDSAAAINAKLAAGLHVVVSPGIYQITEPLLLNTTGQVILGLGLATLVSANQNIIIHVGDVDGARVAGLLLQAGPPSASGALASALLLWGSGLHKGNPANPGFMHDLFARVGGPDGDESQPVGAKLMVHVRSGHVIGDNMWLWRADHAANGPVTYDSNPCDNGLIVESDDVTMYALAVEHTEKDLTVWKGERGRTFFYQSEFPYGVTQKQYGDNGYAGYRVAAGVQAHEAWGVGVYSYFRDHNVTAHSGIVVPAALEPSFHSPLSVFLNGFGGIAHVINEKGKGSFGPGTAVNYVC